MLYENAQFYKEYPKSESLVIVTLKLIWICSNHTILHTYMLNTRGISKSNHITNIKPLNNKMVQTNSSKKKKKKERKNGKNDNILSQGKGTIEEIIIKGSKKKISRS